MEAHHKAAEGVTALKAASAVHQADQTDSADNKEATLVAEEEEGMEGDISVILKEAEHRPVQVGRMAAVVVVEWEEVKADITIAIPSDRGIERPSRWSRPSCSRGAKGFKGLVCYN